MDASLFHLLLDANLIYSLDLYATGGTLAALHEDLSACIEKFNGIARL